MKPHYSKNISVLVFVAALCLLCSRFVVAGDIKPAVELEFNMFYDKNFPQPFTFQMREAKLFLDTYISEKSGGLIEYVMRDNLVRAELERLYFVHRELPLNGQLTLGQFRSPFGYYDVFTVSHSLTKSVAVSPDGMLPAFKLRSLEVGAMWQSEFEQSAFSLAVVNGNGVSSLWDDNNFKDIIGHTQYSLGDVQLGANFYYGRKNSLNEDGSVKTYSNIEVQSYGVEAMTFVGDAVIAGEAVVRNYGDVESAGAYLMMNYNLNSLLHTLRSVTRIETFDPNRSTTDDVRFQFAQGFRYTVDRGYTMKFEYIMNLEQPQQQFNALFLELEYEL
ncbi:MAG: hypothetical protein HYZ34_13990 [Ignavibacteriae bacterium]|nr:hypothetical protein [Ignavibacteriota bacterium]